MDNLFYIIIASILVFMNAFFVAAEFAMVKLRHTRVAAIKKNYGIRGKILAYIHKHLDAYLSACQLGITLASLGLGWVGEPAFTVLLSPLFDLIHIQRVDVREFFAFFIAFTILSFLHIVVGELMPKSLAIRQSEQISLWTAVPLYIFYLIMYPAIWFLNSCANFLLKITGLNKTHKREYFYSTEEIKVILSASHLHGELTKDETEILEHTLDFADLKVTEVMRPYEEMVAINIGQPLTEILQMVITTRFSRYPVYESNKDIIGIIHIKDLFAAMYKEQGIQNLQPFIRPILKVSSRIQAIDLLRKFREGMPHFALVYRAENILGFVTLDNLLHVLIGKIKDEFHRTQDDWILNKDGTLLVKGDCPISSLERALDREIVIDKSLGHPTVIAGLIINKLGRPPYEGERIDFKEFKVTIKKMNGPRIIKIKIYPKAKPKDDDDHLLS